MQDLEALETEQQNRCRRKPQELQANRNRLAKEIGMRKSRGEMPMI